MVALHLLEAQHVGLVGQQLPQQILLAVLPVQVQWRAGWKCIRLQAPQGSVRPAVQSTGANGLRRCRRALVQDMLSCKPAVRVEPTHLHRPAVQQSAV